MTVRRVLWTGAAAVALLPLCGVGGVRAMSREDVFTNLGPYVYLGQSITSANVYPDAPCYTGPGWPSGGQNGERLPIGYWVGEVYGYGLWRKFHQVPGDLSAGRGAGVYKSFYTANSANADCAQAHLTGIDCSAFAGFGWGYASKLSTYSFTDPSIAQPVVTAAEPWPGDVMTRPGHHVFVVYNSPDADGRYSVLEAVGDDVNNRCVKTTHDYDADYAVGYRPYVSNKLKDDPASQIVVFEVDVGGPDPVLRWETLMEDRAASFSIWRSASADGPFEQVSPEIPARGSASGGAVYAYVDAGAGAGSAFYRLMETETNGRVIPHGICSTSEARAYLGARD